MGSNNRDLAAEAARLHQSAQSARFHMVLRNAEQTRDLGVRHDALMQRKRAAEAAAAGERDDAKFAKEAGEQAQQRDKELLAQMKAARDAHDDDKADQLWGEHLRVQTDVETYSGRASRLTHEAEQHEAEAKSLEEPIADVSHDLSRLSYDLKRAEEEVEKLEKKARLLDEAHAKATGDDPVAKLDVDELIERADAINVDTTKIEAIENEGGWVRPEPDNTPSTPMSLPPDKHAPPKHHTPTPDAQPERPEVSKDKEVDLDAADAAAVRAAATAARDAMQKDYQDKATQITEARDQVARDQWSHEQGAKAAQMQIKREQRVVDEGRARVDHLNRDAAALAQKDPAMADSLREQAQRAESDLEVAQNRLAKAQAQADELQAQADREKQDIQKHEQEYRDLQAHRDVAEKSVDGLEERARLLEQAQAKLAQAAQTGNEALRKEAEALVERAEHVHVDPSAIDDASPSPVPTPDESAGPVTHPDQVSANQPTSSEVVGDEPSDAEPHNLAPAAGSDQTVIEEPAATASTGDTFGEMDGTAQATETQESELHDDQVSAFTEEPPAAIASAPEPDEQMEPVDDGNEQLV